MKRTQALVAAVLVAALSASAAEAIFESAPGAMVAFDDEKRICKLVHDTISYERYDKHLLGARIYCSELLYGRLVDPLTPWQIFQVSAGYSRDVAEAWFVWAVTTDLEEAYGKSIRELEPKRIESMFRVALLGDLIAKLPPEKLNPFLEMSRYGERRISIKAGAMEGDVRLVSWRRDGFGFFAKWAGLPIGHPSISLPLTGLVVTTLIAYLTRRRWWSRLTEPVRPT
jgi:hypothetical protein